MGIRRLVNIFLWSVCCPALSLAALSWGSKGLRVLPHFSFGKHGYADIHESQAKFEQTDYNHESIGQLTGMPAVDKVKESISPSYKVLHRCVLLGKGRKIFETASAQLLSFKALNTLPNVHIVSQEGMQITTGSTIATHTRFYNTPIWTLNPCRIVSMVRNAHYRKPSTQECKLRSSGSMKSAQQNICLASGLYSEVVFSTLDGHLIAGEEAMRVYTESSQPGKSPFTKYIMPCIKSILGAHIVDSNDKVFFEVISYSKGSGMLGTLCMPLIRPLQRSFLTGCCNAMFKSCS